MFLLCGALLFPNFWELLNTTLQILSWGRNSKRLPLFLPFYIVALLSTLARRIISGINYKNVQRNEHLPGWSCSDDQAFSQMSWQSVKGRGHSHSNWVVWVPYAHIQQNTERAKDWNEPTKAWSPLASLVSLTPILSFASSFKYDLRELTAAMCLEPRESRVKINVL